MAKTAQLTGSLVAKKGEALPSSTMALDQEDTNILTELKREKPQNYYKALTVKLDRKRYEALKSIGIQLDKKSQDIFVEALDAYLEGKIRKQ